LLFPFGVSSLELECETSVQTSVDLGILIRT
jgi:hypothetical protein